MKGGAAPSWVKNHPLSEPARKPFSSNQITLIFSIAYQHPIDAKHKISYIDNMAPADWKYMRANNNEALKAVRELLRKDAPIRTCKHFRDQAKERNFTLSDARNVISQGRITMRPEQGPSGNWKYRVETKKMFIVFNFDETGEVIELVTGAWLKEGKHL